MKLFHRSLWALAGIVAVAASISAGDEPATPAAGKVEVIRDLAYVSGDNADPERHKLDLYLPADRKDFPVLLFFHGGGYTEGDRLQVAQFGRTLAARGIGVAAVGYRLAPGTRHPGQAQDAAKAVVWVKNNIARHQGRPDGLYVGGHSAGAQLAALLATDEQFLKGEGAALKDLRGVVALSGVYEVLESRQEQFGDAKARKKASPASHVREGLPAFFLAYADKDEPGRDKGAKEFAQALKEKRVVAEVYEAKERDHGSLFSKVQDGDATGAAVIAFILKTERSSADNSSR
jgi:acetyl esterase/lipase